MAGWTDVVSAAGSFLGVVVAAVGVGVTVRVSRRARRETRAAQEREWAHQREELLRTREGEAFRAVLEYHRALASWATRESWQSPETLVVRDRAYEAVGRLEDVSVERARPFRTQLRKYWRLIDHWLMEASGEQHLFTAHDEWNRWFGRGWSDLAEALERQLEAIRNPPSRRGATPGHWSRPAVRVGPSGLVRTGRGWRRLTWWERLRRLFRW